MHISIRPLEDADIPAADVVIRSAFDRPTSFSPMLALHRVIEPEGFWVAVDGSKIVGTVGAIDYGRVAYIALMTVLPELQGRGLGRRLMNHALAWLAARGCRVVLLDATAKGAALYETMGFVDDSTAYDYARPAEALPPPTVATSHVRPARATDLPGIVALDAPWFGADRQKLFAALWPLYGECCLVAHDDAGKLAGYLFARDPVLGPWGAATPAMAKELLAAGLAMPRANPPMVMLPRSNRQAIELVESFGFVQRRTLRHMRLGGQQPPGQPQYLNGQSSFGHG
jgi:ribosomal protein S18 acetylase RimI-like enzyme